MKIIRQSTVSWVTLLLVVVGLLVAGVPPAHARPTSPPGAPRHPRERSAAPGATAPIIGAFCKVAELARG